MEAQHRYWTFYEAINIVIWDLIVPPILIRNLRHRYRIDFMPVGLMKPAKNGEHLLLPIRQLAFIPSATFKFHGPFQFIIGGADLGLIASVIRPQAVRWGRL